jgi:carbon monoxide dehydrogenase subunit G
MTDLDAARKWMDVVSIEKTTEGPYGVGTKWTETRKMFGKSNTEHFEVTEYVPNERIGLHVDGSKGSSGKGEYRFVHTVEKEGAGTKVTWAGTIDMPGRLAGIMSKLFGWIFTRGTRKELASMKAYAEGITQ